MQRHPNNGALSSPKGFLIALLVITAAAFTLRLAMTSAFVGLASAPDASASPDQLEYDAIFQQLIAGNGYAGHDGQPTARRAPGMVFTLLPVYALTDGSYAATRLAIITLSSLTCLLVGLAVAGVFYRRAGLIAAALLAVMPGHAYYAMHLLSEGVFGFWLALAVWVTFKSHAAETGKHRLMLLAGLCWGMAVLTKPQFVLLAPLVVLVALFIAARRWDWRPAMSAALCLLAAAAVVMPWYARNAAVLDAPGLSTIGGYGLWAGNNELVLNDPQWRGRAMPTSEIEARLGVKLPEGEGESDAQAKVWAWQFMSEHRDRMPELTAWKLYRLVTPFQATENKAVWLAQSASWIVFAPWLVAGVVVGLRRRPIPSLVWLGPMVVTVGVTLVFFAIIRYRDALLPAMVPFAAIAIDLAVQHVRARLGGTAKKDAAPLGVSPEQPQRLAA